MCYCTRVILVHYCTDDTCATVHVHHATTDRNTRALSTRGYARPRVNRADRWIANLCAHRSLCYSTRARWPDVGTPTHVCTVYGRSGLNLRARADRYTTSTCRLVRAGYCTQLKIKPHNSYYRAGAATTCVHYCTRVMLTDFRTDDTCDTVHIRRATTAQNTRAPYMWVHPSTCTPYQPPD